MVVRFSNALGCANNVLTGHLNLLSWRADRADTLPKKTESHEAGLCSSAEWHISQSQEVLLRNFYPVLNNRETIRLVVYRCLGWTSSPLSSHTRTVVRECFKGDEASQWKRPKFDPSPRQKPFDQSWQKLAWVKTSCQILSRSFGGFCPPYMWFSVPSEVTFFNVFFGTCNSLQPTPLNGFLRKIGQKMSFRPKACLLGVPMTTINM